MNLNAQIFRQNQPYKDFPSAVALAMQQGVDVEVKFGSVEDAAAGIKTDIWELGGSQPVYIFPNDAGEAIEILSSVIGDTMSITIGGLDASGNLQTETVTLTGTTPVSVPGTWRAINRAFNSNGTPFTGNITIRGDGSTSTNVFAYLNPDNQQTTQAVYMVPAGKVAVINNYSTAINVGGNQDATAIMRFESQVQGGVFRTQIRYGLQKRGTSNLSSDLIVPPVLPPLTKLKGNWYT